MWRKTTCAAGGLLAACAAAYLVPATGSHAQPSSFESRWLAINPGQKGDRIERPRAGSQGAMHFFALPTVQTTVVVKDHRKPASYNMLNRPEDADEPRNGSMNELPVVPVRNLPHNVKRKDSKDKLPIGCESSFSPVTTPVMANVSGRCLS